MSIFDRLPKLDESMRIAIVRALIYIGIVISVAYMAEQSGMITPDEPVTVAMEMPSPVFLSGDAGLISVPVTVRLKNNTSTATNLEAPTTCHIFRWFITTTTGEFIQSEGDTNCVAAVMTAALPAGEMYEEEMELAFDQQRLRGGVKYLLMFRFWGQDGQAEFTAETE